MNFNYTQKLLAGTLALVLVAGMASPAFAGLDTTPPTTVCPDDAAIQLGDSTDPSNTGGAGCADSESGCQSVTFSDENSLNVCDAGTIERTWTATDGSGNTSSCVQTITIEGECVAGELLPLDNTALLLAGIQSMTVWMIPTVLGLAGAGVYLVKFRANRG